MDEKVVREQLVALLKGEHAHASVEHAVAGLDPKLRAAPASQGVKSV